MGTFLEDLASFLEAKGHPNISLDAVPDSPDDAVGLFLYAHIPLATNDGSGTRHIQVQVRDTDDGAAYARASAMCALLDSGMDEEVITLSPDRWCVARPRALPSKLSEDGSRRVTYYFETALWGPNEP